MPLSGLHKKKFRKNLAVGLGLLGFIALFWIITMVKIAAQGGG